MDRRKKAASGKPGVSVAHHNMGFGPRPRPRRASAPARLRAKRSYVFCHYCGHTPQTGRTDQACPKCNHHAWETGTVGERLVAQND